MRQAGVCRSPEPPQQHCLLLYLAAVAETRQFEENDCNPIEGITRPGKLGFQALRKFETSMATDPVIFEDLLVAIYDAAADAGRWPDALVAIADHVGADSAILVDNGGSAEHSSVLQVRSREDLSDLYIRQHTDNAWTRAVSLQPVGRVHIAGRLVEKRVLHRTACYDEILRPQKIANMIVLSHPYFADRGGCGGIGLCLSEAADADAAGRAARLEQIAPHLVRAIDLSVRVDARRSGASIDTFLEMLATAALALDGRGCVVAANRRAEALLATGNGIMLDPNDRNRLVAVRSDDRRQFDGALARALAPTEADAGSTRRTVRLQRPGGTPLAASFTPLHERVRWPWVDGAREPRALVMIADPSAPGQDHTAALQAGFGLTKAEARVADLIGGGITGPEAAVRLKLSPGTVKTHLSRIFQKTGVRNQAGIARLLAGLPAEG